MLDILSSLVNLEPDVGILNFIPRFEGFGAAADGDGVRAVKGAPPAVAGHFPFGCRLAIAARVIFIAIEIHVVFWLACQHPFT